MSSSTSARCKNCHFPLSPTHMGPCPKCGKFGKEVFVRIIEESIEVRDWIRTSVQWTAQRVYYKKYPKQHGIMIGLTILPAIVGRLLPLEFDLLLGIVGGLYIYFFGQWLGARKNQTDQPQ